jgi:acetyl esterase/lipase
MATRIALAWLCSVALASLVEANSAACGAESGSGVCKPAGHTGSALLQAKISRTKTTIASADGTTSEKDVKYGSHDLQAMDFYWPDAQDPEDGWPVVVGFHGIKGDKSKMSGFCANVIKESELTRACVAGNYRDTPSSYGLRIKDVGLAIKWLVKNAASYKINDKSIILYGYSQGAMLVNYFIWDHNDFTNEHVSAVIFAAGIGGNAVEHASSDTPHPPILVIHSKDDKTVRYKSVPNFVNKLAPQGGIVRLLTYLTAGHYPMAEPSYQSQIDAFLDNPLAYEAPDPLSFTTTPAPLICKGKCSTHKKDWSIKCSWGDCAACDECEGLTTTTTTKKGSCKWNCNWQKSIKWTKKCKWSSCGGCDECA